MNENIDLTKILEGCPEGTEFYSILHDKVFFRGINFDNDYPVTFSSPIMVWSIGLTKEGRALMDVGECIVFPSEDQRDWSKFERFWDKPKKADKFDPTTLKPFQEVLVRKIHSRYNISPWSCEFFSYINPNTPHLVNGIYSRYEICIPYNEETKHLRGTEEDCPDYYKWWKIEND